jgi:hypothetical protein
LGIGTVAAKKRPRRLKGKKEKAQQEYQNKFRRVPRYDNM